MKRGKKLIVLLAVLVVLMGGTYVMQQINFEEEEPEETESVTEVIYAATEEEIKEISWTYDGNEFSFIRTEDGWINGTDENFPVDENVVSNVLAKLEELTSTKTIEAAADLAEYGLDEPAVAIHVTTDESCEILIGDASALGGYYASLGDGNVYVIGQSVFNMFSKELYDFVLEEELPDLTTIRKVVSESEARDLTLLYEEGLGLVYSDDYVWYLVSDDGMLALDNELTEALLTTVSGVEWTECVDYYADKEELKTYGLDEPMVSLTVSYVESTQVDTGEKDDDGNVIYETKEEVKTLELLLGGYSDESCYAKLKDSSMVYLVDAELSDSLMYATYDSLRPDDVLLMDWDDVTGVDVILNGTTYTVLREEVEGTDDDGNKTVSYLYKLGDNEVEVLNVLDMLVAMESTGSKDGIEPERAEEIRFVLHRDNENFPEVELAFYQYDSTSCLVSLNGESRLFVAREDVTDVVEAFNQMVLEAEETDETESE